VADSGSVRQRARTQPARKGAVRGPAAQAAERDAVRDGGDSGWGTAPLSRSPRASDATPPPAAPARDAAARANGARRRAGRPPAGSSEGAPAARTPQPDPAASPLKAPPVPYVPAVPVRVETVGTVFPVVPLRGIVVYPGSSLPLQVGRHRSLRAVAAAVAADGRVVLCAQRDPERDEPDAADLYGVGTLALLREVRAEGNGTLRVLAEGLSRVRLRSVHLGERLQAGGLDDGRGCLLAEVELLPEPDANGSDGELESLAEAVLARFAEWKRLVGRLADASPLPPVQEPGRLADAIAARVVQRPEDRQAILEAVSPRQRLQRLRGMLSREAEQAEVERDVSRRVRRQLDRTQREYYLREQMKAIQQELGEGEGGQGEAAELRARLRAARLPAAARERAEREVDRLEKMPPLAAESVVVRTYVDWILSLPWTEMAADRADLDVAQRVLDEDHHGIVPVKERILEYLALRQLRGRARGPVLCFVGPPGAGKTSLVRSIARALDRPFVRVSLGGVRDEAEIRGHRRTYVGALPGRILYGMRQAGRRNPVFLLDEIDKMGADFRGDPAAALLEVLDPEQNHAFSDHYLELPFDLSDVMFVATANALGPLTRPLLDRLEVIELSGYSDEEKLQIARRFLVPRQIRDAGLEPFGLRITDGALRLMIARYTREAGVRGLERQVATVCRKVAREVVQSPRPCCQVTARNLGRYLGPPRLHRQGMPERDEVGVAVALAWTESGGDLLILEASVLPGRGALHLTGKLGEVMRESAQAALTYIRSRAEAYGLPADFLERCELHVHAPEGAIPKEGPSAGVALATALLSALTGSAVRRDVALTGEITLRGRVLPVGGIKEKVLAARRAGARWVVLPAANRADWEELPPAHGGDLEPVFVERAEDALALALTDGLPGPAATAARAPRVLLRPAAPAAASAEGLGVG
jgi:ATP-dependent Lon protease